MTTASTTLLGLALPVTGELSGTWGDVVNASLTNLLDTAIAGTTTLSSDADVTLTTTTLSANQARQAVILWTAGGTATRTITAPAQSKSYVVINATSSSQSIKLVGAGPTTGITIVAGEKCFAAWNGSDFVKVGNTSGAGVFSTVTASSLTSGRVTYAGTAGLLQDSANLTFNGTTLTANTIGAFTLGGTVAGGGNQLNNVVIGTSNPLAGAFTTLSSTINAGGNTAVAETILNTGGNTAVKILGTAGGTAGAMLNARSDGSLRIYQGTTTGADGTQAAVFDSTGLAVTGTLSATGNITASGGDFIGAGAASYAQLRAGAADSNTIIVRGTGSTNQIEMVIGGSNRAVVSSTGLAVTGTLSSTTTATIGAASGVKSLTVSSSDNNASVIIAAGNGATGGLRFNNYAGTQHWNIYETTGGSGQQGNLSIYNEVAAANQLVLDSSGNLGLGVTPSAWDTGGSTKAIQVSTLSTLAQAYGSTFVGNNWYYAVAADRYLTTAAASRYSQAAGAHAWYNAPSGTAGNAITFTQAMTLDESGNLLVGITSGAASFRARFYWSTAAGQNGLMLEDGSNSSGTSFLYFAENGTGIGSVTRVGATAAVIYNTTSDYRLKNVIGAVSGQGERIDALKPIDYKWKSGNLNSRGFLAHEFQEVYENSVTGTKDAVDEDGNPVYQAMQAATSEVIADLVAELQSLRKRITALEAK